MGNLTGSIGMLATMVPVLPLGENQLSPKKTGDNHDDDRLLT